MTELSTLADRISLLLSGISLRPTMIQVVEIGQLLTQAKRLCGHGRWQTWLKMVGIPPRTASTYMQVANRLPEADITEPLSIKAFLREMRQASYWASKDMREMAIKDARRRLGTNDVNWQVHHADCREFPWPQVDHIFTDPPWEDVGLYRWLAAFAMNNLKDGGFLFVQCRQDAMPELFEIFAGLHYVWTCVIVYDTSTSLAHHFNVNWRPCLLFSKGNKTFKTCASDVMTIRTDMSQKNLHEWQQPLKAYTHFVQAISNAGDLIADPFTCTGTTAVAAKLTGRRFIGTEIDGDMVKVARARLLDT